MKSKASFKSHPLHPMLIPFPFAFLTGALLFDLAAALTGSADLASTGRNLTLAGLGAGLIAAVPGLIDFFFVVPPASSGRKQAITHGVSSVAALGLFGAGYLFRQDAQASTLTLVLELGGLLVMSSAAWMGGALVYRNQIGVDHRYANAGKWKETSVARTGDRAVVGESDDLKLNQMMLVHANNSRIVVARTDDGCRAFADRCTHKGGPLSDGALMCGTVQCPWHGSQFDVATGKVRAGPATEPIATHYVEEANGQIRLGV